MNTGQCLESEEAARSRSNLQQYMGGRPQSMCSTTARAAQTSASVRRHTWATHHSLGCSECAKNMPLGVSRTQTAMSAERQSSMHEPTRVNLHSEAGELVPHSANHKLMCSESGQYPCGERAQGGCCRLVCTKMLLHRTRSRGRNEEVCTSTTCTEQNGNVHTASATH